ncbi:MAG TPA: type 2 lanthipeptide synthetase LanM family protein, partial [Blastocatellia bacterium]|nr:type 2 lanthipeptide synthetase LanM family protein [Blastocatellia bacterium]
NHALDRFREGVQLMIRERETVPFDPQTVEVKFIPGLSRVLVQMLAQTVILELNIARLRGQLSGDTPETRFQSFVERLREPETALAILEEYPVLARQLTLRIDCWLDYSLEFLTHLCHDWEAIQADFGGSRDLGLLAEIDDCAGDTHRRGRSVLIVTFSSGFKIVYKPRSLAADVHFQQLLEWLNERNSCPALRTLKVLDRGAYGWQEFVAAENCASKAEVERFYQRQGGYLALLYTLQATDFHLENLIAAGEHPVLIDLESLFHPGLVSAPGAGSEVLADERLDRSVLRVGLLPSQVWIDEEGEGVDLSGLGGAPGQLTPFGVLYLEEAGTDEMRVSRRRMAISGGRNRPSLNGGDVNLQEFGEAIIAGFKRTYRTLQEHRHELLAENSPLSRFADDEVRVILRPTRTYGRLLHESYHPNLLRHGLDRELYFDQLWIAAESQPELVRVIAAEHRDLQHGDVPIFITRAGALDLWDSSGQPVPGWIRESGLTRAHTLISDLGDDDLDRQVWFIRASWTSLSQEPAGPARASRPASPSIESPSPASPVNRASLLKMACRIGDRLDQLAVRGKDDATWLGLTFVNERSSPLKPLGIDLYSGLPGVILFLANLGDFAGEDRYTVLARAAFSNLQRQIEKLRPSLIRIGGFTGWGGVIYLMTRLGALWRERALFEQAEDLVDLVSGLVEKDEDYDMIAGSAGCIGALLSLYQTTGSSVSFSVAGRCGDRLIACRKPMTTGHGWCGRASGATPPPGFSHGAGGIAWALLKLAALTDVDHYRAAARGAIEYERSLFSPAHRGWPDLRGRDLRISRGQDDRASMVTWCHGAPGIGLGRLDSLSQLDDDETCAEIRTAIELTLTQGFGQNHSLCHGDLGNLDFLIQAQATLADASLRIEIERLSAVILEDLERHGVFCGVPGGVETPGLMNGLAGIGYGLLRLAEPSRLPSVLTLAAPPAE